jgi:hypothetical protein
VLVAPAPMERSCNAKSCSRLGSFIFNRAVRRFCASALPRHNWSASTFGAKYAQELRDALLHAFVAAASPAPRPALHRNRVPIAGGLGSASNSTSNLQQAHLIFEDARRPTRRVPSSLGGLQTVSLMRLSRGSLYVVPSVEARRSLRANIQLRTWVEDHPVLLW